MTLEEEFNPLSLTNATDNTILMHREVHFGGNFDAMLEYYSRGGKGVLADFDLDRMLFLRDLEKTQGQNLAPQLLTAEESEKVKEAKEAYKKLRDTYKKSPTKIPKLLADLILTEEENPEKEIAALLSEKKALPILLDLVKNENFYDPLFPGYGKAPFLAMKCLGQMGDPKAIIALFESIGRGDFFDDEIALKALREIGEPAKQFLLRVLKGKPINEDNERAAIALLAFKNDPEIAETCFQMLLELDLKKEAFLATYLILACSGLKNTPLEKSFKELASGETMPKDLKGDLKSVLDEWKKSSP